MRYHNITKDDMLNGDGLRVVLWVSGCSHCCKGCQNPITWDPNSGLIFDETAKMELFEQLEKPYIDGITFSGGDPLHDENIKEISNLIDEIRKKFPLKTIWLYSGYTYAYLQKFDASRYELIQKIDTFVDGKYEESLRDVNLPFRGSSNQNIVKIRIKEE